MATTSGTIKSVTVGATSCSFTILTDPNPSPPPPTLETQFDGAPDWVKDAVLPNVGKPADVTYSGTPPSATITAVKVRAS